MSVSNEQENKTNSSSEKNTQHIIIPSLFDTEKKSRNDFIFASILDSVFGGNTCVRIQNIAAIFYDVGLKRSNVLVDF